MSSMNCMLLVVALASLVALASGLMCHQCQSLDLKDCIDQKIYQSKVDTLGECDDDNYCVKYKTLVWIRDSGFINGKLRNSTVVTRTCEPRLGRKEGCVGWQNNGGISLKCYCGTDRCNTGFSLTPKLISASIVCLLGFMASQFLSRH